MYTYDQQCMMDLSDNYTLLYAFIVRQLLDAFGTPGERAVREGTRRYGQDRGRNSRERHLAMGCKINMHSLFGLGGDLPPDPRFRRELQELNDQERVSHTLICPMADVWKAYGEREIGRIYCEEFHFACYNTYTYGYTQVNLAKTLTQETDDYCAFNIVLRPEILPDELKKQCFASYDPDYSPPQLPAPPTPTVEMGKKGFGLLSIKLYYYLLETAMEAFGEAGAEAVERALSAMALDGAKRARATAETHGKALDDALFGLSYPIPLDPQDALWEGYRKHGAPERYQRHFVPAFRQAVGQL